jgi:transcriptional regulator GlxA family with amidase domain
MDPFCKTKFQIYILTFMSQIWEIITLRLDHAWILLQDSADSIQSILGQCGYQDNSNLTSAFREKFSLTP